MADILYEEINPTETWLYSDYSDLEIDWDTDPATIKKVVVRKEQVSQKRVERLEKKNIDFTISGPAGEASLHIRGLEGYNPSFIVEGDRDLLVRRINQVKAWLDMFVRRENAAP